MWRAEVTGAEGSYPVFARGLEGWRHPVVALDVRRLQPPMRLVVLNACDTGRGSATDEFSSTAAALIRREVPAVVAMQFTISDPAATNSPSPSTSTWPNAGRWTTA